MGPGWEASPNLKPAAGDRLLEHRDGVYVLEQCDGELGTACMSSPMVSAGTCGLLLAAASGV